MSRMRFAVPAAGDEGRTRYQRRNVEIFITGPPSRVLSAWIADAFDLVVSTAILEEYREVAALLGAKFPGLEKATAFIHSAEIFRTLRKKGRTIRSPADCLIAACVMEETASLLEDDADFHTIAEVAPLKLLES